jgi:hypothetical protein
MADNDKTRVSADADPKGKNKAEKNADEIQFFETTITKLVERENPVTGEKETVEVLSDNLYPGEKLKRVDDEEKAAAKAETARKAAEQRRTDK